MPKELNSAYGKLVLQDEVVAALAGAALTDCPGVVGMAARRLKDGWADLLGRENWGRGVELEAREGRLWVHVSIVVRYGAVIPEVGREAIARVKRAIEEGTGLAVHHVRVHVQGVRP